MEDETITNIDSSVEAMDSEIAKIRETSMTSLPYQMSDRFANQLSISQSETSKTDDGYYPPAYYHQTTSAAKLKKPTPDPEAARQRKPRARNSQP